MTKKIEDTLDYELSEISETHRRPRSKDSRRKTDKRKRHASREENNGVKSNDPSCWLATWVQITDNFVIRLFSTIFTLQAAIMWIAFAINFMLTLLFAPFNDRKIGSFITSWLIVPGITFFAANFFWFLFQIAMHAFSLKMDPPSETLEKQPEKWLLFGIHSHVSIRRTFRTAVCVMTVMYILIEFGKGRHALDALMASLGQVPLSMMYTLLVLHGLSMIFFTGKSIRSLGKLESQENTDDESDEDEFLPKTPRRRHVAILIVQVVIPLLLQIISTFLPFASVGWALVTVPFIVWLLWFNLCFPPMLNHDQGRSCCCGITDASCLSVFCSCVIKKQSDKKEMNELERFLGFKFFIIIGIIGMCTVLSFIQQSNGNLSSGIKGMVIFGIVLMWFFEFFLLLPLDLRHPWMHKMDIQNVQSLILGILHSIIALIIVVGFILMLASSKRTAELFVCLLAPLVYHVSLFFYLVFTDIIHPIRHSREKRKFPGMRKWLESYVKVSLYPRVYYIMSIILLVVGVVGLMIGLTVYKSVSEESDEALNETTYLHGDFSVGQSATFRTLMLKDQKEQNIEDLLRSNEMKLCYWKIDDFNIQDAILFAALAYKPTRQLQDELNAFYNETNIKFTIDEESSHYNARGYGDITYFTAYNDHMVVVSIRGTTRLYDWLVNLDTWSEALIYQVISMLFPWSKFFPEYMTRRLIRHMSILERLMEDQDSTRSFVKQAIIMLRKVENTYLNNTARKMIVVGHSLGGGLTKLAGIALNSSTALVSVSGPGASYSHNKDDDTTSISMESVNRRTLNILNDRDVVPMIDKQEGLVQTLTCPLDYSLLNCHSVKLTLCNSIKICGNPKNFKFEPKFCNKKG